jgi:predicted porin
MQKKMIALAVAGLASTAALAQSNVSVYGAVDLSQGWVRSSGADNDQRTVGRLDNNSSYIGFKGVEDLGNGLKAVFQIENNVTPDSGGGNLADRDSFIALAGGFGTVAAGTLTHALRAMGGRVDITPGVSGFGGTNTVTGAIHGLKTGADDRARDAIAYLSPTFGGGFSVSAAYGNGEQRRDGNTDATHYNAKAWQVAAQYDNGPLFVGIGYHQTADNLRSADFGGNANYRHLDARVWRVAAAYTTPFGARFSALYDNTRVDNGIDALSALGVIAPGNNGDIRRSAWSASALQTFGANSVGLQYARAGKTRVSGSSTLLNDYDDRANIWTALYTYSLSKRTLVHVRYSRLSNGDEGATNFYENPVDNGANPGNGVTYSGFMIGLRHSF